jgi:type VI secretion system protein ImpJ
MTANGPQRVVWSEGLLIGPQHLQQLDLYHERLLGMRLEAVEPLHWGVVRVDLDAAALAAGQIKLQRLHAVMPDGAVLSLEPGDAELPAMRQVDGQFSDGRGRLELWVGLPREREGIDNYGEGTARYRVARREVRDATAPERTGQVAFGQRNAVLLFGDEPHTDHVVLKVAELTRDQNGRLLAIDAYVPPCLRVSASPFLIAGMRRLLDNMSTRRRSLQEARRQSGRNALEWSAMDVTRYLLLATINNHLPILQYLVETGDVGPRSAYFVLVQLAGQLCSFVADADPLQLPKFAYRDLNSTFEPLFAQITQLLLATVSEHYVAVPLQARDDGMHVAQLQDPRLAQCKQFVLAVKTDLPERQVATQLPQFAKLAATSEIQSIVRSATPGVPLEVNHRPPPQIPVQAGHVYFDVQHGSPYWKRITQERELVVYLPPFFEPTRTQLVLMGLPEAEPQPATPARPRGAS